MIDILTSLAPVLFLIIMLVAFLFPNTDKYFKKGKLLLANVDDVLDQILLRWPNEKLQTVDDLVGRLREQLRKAGYKIEGKEEELKTHAEAVLNRKEGVSIDWRDGIGKINFKKKF